jgi:small-conductance mechanosensitive channel
MNWFEKFLNYELLTLGDTTLRLGSILLAGLIIIAAWLFVRVFSMMMQRRLHNMRGFDKGRRHAIISLSKYFIYVVAGLLVFQALGFNITVLVAGSTAFFVGIGLGLQNTFKDIMGGMILMFDRTLEVEDVVEVNGMVGRVKRIGLRTSTIQTRDDISIIVPNGKFVSENVTNWSHQDATTRFHLDVSVAYGSSPTRVRELLVTCANAHTDVAKDTPARVFFQDFGENGMQFRLLFWTEKSFEAEQTLSDLRFAVEAAFRREGIVIPFPQRVLHIPSGARFPGEA